MRFDNLKVGKWYAMFESEVTPTGPPWRVSEPVVAHSGLPMRIESVSYPFVFLRDVFDNPVTVDARVHRLTSVSPAFVRSWRNAGMERSGQPVRTKRRKKLKPDRYTCPRCHGPLRQTMTIASQGWRWVCKECGWDAGSVLNGEK